MSAARAIASLVTAALLVLHSLALANEPDMPGSKDFEDFPRVDGTYIAGYQFSEFDAGRFVARLDDRKRGVLTNPEGARTRIIYLGQEAQTSLQLLRNYQQAFAGFGEYQEHFACRGDACETNMATQFVWTQDNRIKTSFRNGYSLYQSFSYRDSAYAYGTIIRGEKVYHVSAFSAYLLPNMTGVNNVPIVHLEILEMESFKPSLVFVGADEISSTIAELGAISLYGIQFPFDSAEPSADSTATLTEIAKVLKADSELEIFVVGHTDNVGEYAYNQKLSADRAKAIVTILARDHGVSGDRMSGIGVGPVAPKASNDSDAGREMNRRVEIVKR